MNLIRGCGLRGLLGIDFKNGDLIRPFFNACEDEISAFVNSQAIEFRVDESNFSDDFLRNRIRKKLLKKKSDENSQISFFTKNFSKFQKEFSDLFAQSRNFSKKWLKSNSSFEKGFPCDEFAKLSDWQKSELLTYIYELKYASTTNLSSAQIAKWIELIEKKSSGKHKELGSKFYLSVDFGFFHLIEKNFHEASLPKTPQLLKLGINKFGFCEIKVSTNSEGAGQGIYLPKSLFAEGVYVRSFQSGDKITFQNRRITKKLSDFFAETKIPLHTRSKIPIFTNKKGEILAVGNLWTRENLLQNKQNKNTLCTGSTQKTGDAKCWTEEKPQPYCEHTVRIFSKEAQAGRFFQCFLNENSISNKR
jgi:tRNA(Ile)-lysidine synthase